MTEAQNRRLTQVNQALRKHDMKIIHDGQFYLVQKLAIRGFTSASIYPVNYKSIQGALDWLASICRDAMITNY